MGLYKKKKSELSKVICQLEKDRAWLLEHIDKGTWPDLRRDLAALERELGQLLIRIEEKLDD